MTSHDVPRDSGMHRGDIMAFIFQKPTIERISACTPRFRYAKSELPDIDAVKKSCYSMQKTYPRRNAEPTAAVRRHLDPLPCSRIMHKIILLEFI